MTVWIVERLLNTIGEEGPHFAVGDAVFLEFSGAGPVGGHGVGGRAQVVAVFFVEDWGATCGAGVGAGEEGVVGIRGGGRVGAGEEVVDEVDGDGAGGD